MTMAKTKPIRAVGYCRTSGEGQRDNTSIPTQKKDIEKFVKANSWKFVKFYVDESKSGSRIRGRDDFQLMLKDAAKDKFDIIVSYDVDRFARDGVDIVYTARELKRNCGVSVCDTKSQFDNRDNSKTIINFVRAGLAEEVKRTIVERTTKGRKAKAKDGLPWSHYLPWGRGFDKNTGTWFITEQGKQFAKLCKEYADGSSSEELAKKYGWKHSCDINRVMRIAQISGTYIVKFRTEDFPELDEDISVPAVPALVDKKLAERIKARAAHNKICNRQIKDRYKLTGFVVCSECGKRLIGQTSPDGKYVYYRHGKHSNCNLTGIQGDKLEKYVLDYLYKFFVNGTEFNKAVNNALEDNEDREALENDIVLIDKKLNKAKKEISNLVKAIMQGADASLLIDAQSELKAKIQTLELSKSELQQTLDSMIDPKVLKQDATLLRWNLIRRIVTTEWQKIPYIEIRSFMHFLFSDNPIGNNYGIFIEKDGKEYNLTFKGCFSFSHQIVDGDLEYVDGITEAQKEKLKRKLASRDNMLRTGKAYETVAKKAKRLEELIEAAAKATKKRSLRPKVDNK